MCAYVAIFAFDLYDRDSTGVLEPYDLDNMLKDIYGKAAGSSHYAKQYVVSIRSIRHRYNIIFMVLQLFYFLCLELQKTWMN